MSHLWQKKRNKAMLCHATLPCQPPTTQTELKKSSSKEYKANNIANGYDSNRKEKPMKRYNLNII